MASRRFGKAVAAGALMGSLLLAAPAGAAKILSGVVAVPFTGASSGLTLFGGSHGIDNTVIGKKPDVFLNNPQAVAAVPEPAGWLMMLLGFGLLGLITRRGTLAEAQRAL